MEFDPDAYLKSKGWDVDTTGFDPDAYLGLNRSSQGMGDLKTAESQMPPPPKYYGANNPVFPSAGNIKGEGFGKSAARVGMGVIDVLDAPARAAATTRGMSMRDPNAYLLRPEAEEAIGANRQAQARYSREMPAEGLSPEQHYFQMQNRGAPASADGVTELPYRIASDPLLLTGLLKHMVKKAPGLLESFAKSVGWTNEQAGKLAQQMSGVPEETLRAWGNKDTRAAIQQNFGKEKEIGDELLGYIENAHDYMPEGKLIDDAVQNMDPIDIGSAVRAMEGAKSTPAAGRLSPVDRAGNASIDPWVDFLRGGPVPENIDQSVRQAAGEAIDARGALKGEKSAFNAVSKEAAQAERLQARAASASGKAANEVKNLPDKGKGFWRWHTNEEDAAKEAARVAREAAVDARAKLAVREISKADYSAAIKASEAAENRLQILSAARQIKNGANLKEIAKSLSEGGMPQESIQGVLTKARTYADGLKDLPDQVIPASEYLRIRRKLDVPINWAEEGVDIKSGALKAGRGTMKDELIAAAERSGNTDYAKWMRSYSDKLDKLDKIKDLVGKNATTREKRVESFVNNLFGKNSAYKQEVMRDLDEIFQSNLTERAKLAQMGQELGEKGAPAWLPTQATGRSLMGYAAAQVVPVVGQAIAIATASPKIAARVTLPTLTKLEKVLSEASIALSPKAKKAVAALKNPLLEDAQRARFASILAEELKANPEIKEMMEMPPNAVPFEPRRQANGGN